MLKNRIKELLFLSGYDIVRHNSHSHPIGRRLGLLSSYRIDLILDV